MWANGLDVDHVHDIVTVEAPISVLAAPSINKQVNAVAESATAIASKVLIARLVAAVRASATEIDSGTLMSRGSRT